MLWQIEVKLGRQPGKSLNIYVRTARNMLNGSADLKKQPMPVLVVGSIAIDNLKTQLEERREVLGGAASYGSVAASYLPPVNLVGIVGTDFPQAYIELLNL